ncbi:beta-Ig-H3 fasciclin [Chlorella sorokiniana]|uniref:Beta-Ig-H3 fasciclin n=1 Tax=Chlorella sorokiniana TaxID=3076 RepID=A0A2P6TUL1_CHLSO|nr:beta-Ig-H3 fasciclin [Chlorella sorokiniana]|eukprot:PRW57755.1 beta-Ig-H3 fasciclin [Chlorella sorokiniana]
MTRPAAALVLLLLTCSAWGTASRELLAKKKPFAANLYEAIGKSGLTITKLAVDASGLASQLANPNLKITLLAPSDAGWQRYFQDCRTGVPEYWNAAKFCSLQQLLDPANKTKLQQLLKYHMIQGPELVPLQRGSKFWHEGLRFYQAKTLQSLNIVQLRYWHMLDEAGGFEAHGTGRDGSVLTALSDRPAGKALLHVVSDVLTAFPSPF